AEAEQVGFPLRRDELRTLPDRLRRWHVQCLKSSCLVRATAHGAGDVVRQALEIGLFEAVDVAEVGGIVEYDPHRGPELLPALSSLDLAVVERGRKAASPFRVELGEIAAVRQCASEHALRE